MSEKIRADGMEQSRGEEGYVMIHPDSPPTMDVQAAAPWDLEIGLPDDEPPTPESTGDPMDIDQYVVLPTDDPYLIKSCCCCCCCLVLILMVGVMAIFFFVGKRP